MDQNRKNGSNYQAGGTCSTDNNTAKQTTGPCHYRVVYRGCSDIATMCRIATQIHEDIEKKNKKLRESGADVNETKIRVLVKMAEDINLKKWITNQKKKEEKEKKEQEKQNEIDIKDRFKDMAMHFAKKGVHVYLSLGKSRNKQRKIWN